MLLSKSIAVYLNLVACEFKKYTATMLKQGKVELTPEQFLLIDLLWNDGPMSQQKLADTMRMCGTPSLSDISRENIFVPKSGLI